MNGLFFSIVGSKTRRTVAILLSFVLFATSFTLTPAKAYADGTINSISITGPTSVECGSSYADNNRLSNFSTGTENYSIQSVALQRKNNSDLFVVPSAVYVSSGTYRYAITVVHGENSQFDSSVSYSYNGASLGSVDSSGDTCIVYSSEFEVVDSTFTEFAGTVIFPDPDTFYGGVSIPRDFITINNAPQGLSCSVKWKEEARVGFSDTQRTEFISGKKYKYEISFLFTSGYGKFGDTITIGSTAFPGTLPGTFTKKSDTELVYSSEEFTVNQGTVTDINNFTITCPGIGGEVHQGASVSNFKAVTVTSDHRDKYDVSFVVFKYSSADHRYESQYNKDTFEPGEYHYQITLTIPNNIYDYLFAANATGTLNGNSVEIFGTSRGLRERVVHYRSAPFKVNIKSITAAITCQALSADSLAAISPSLSVTEPAIDGFSLNKHWEKDGVAYNGTTFEPGTYKLFATITPPEGLSYTADLTKSITLNGQSATVVSASSGSIDVLLGSITIDEPVQDENQGMENQEQGSGGQEQSSGSQEQGTGGQEQETGGQEQGAGGQEQETGGQEQGTGGQEQETGGQEQTTDLNLNYDEIAESEKTVVNGALAGEDNSYDPGYGVFADIAAATVLSAKVIIPEQVLEVYEAKQEYAGKNLSITPSVTPVTTEQVGPAVVDSFNTCVASLGLNNPAIRFYNITLNLTENGTVLEQVTDTAVPVEIQMSVSGNSLPSHIARYHNGKAEILGTKLQSRNTVGDMNNKQEGLYTDSNSNTAYLYSNGFSTYALIYDNPPANNSIPVKPVAASEPGTNPVPNPVYEEPPQIVEMIPVHRLYNTVTGSHFFTINKEEADEAVNCGYQYEGIGFMTPSYSSVPVYRLYDYDTDEHYYTIDFVEAQLLASNGGFVYEGIAWYSAEPSGQTVYVLRASGSLTVYTISVAERDMLKSLGWEEKEAGFFAG